MQVFHLGTDRAQIHENFDERGYVIIDDFLPPEAVQPLLSWYEDASWEVVDQVRPDHYKHVFSLRSAYLPKADESYQANFDRSQQLERRETFQELFQKHFVPRLSDVSRQVLTTFDTRCYRMRPGQFNRTHIDAYAGAIGLIYYLNPRWCWDWGGLLCVADDSDPEALDVIYPRFNRLVLLNHEKFRFPHFVSPINPYAKAPRYTIVSFGK